MTKLESNPRPFSIGQTVTRLARDYTSGRTGHVIELSDGRARVMWTSQANGEPMRLRTWVRFKDLAPA